MKSFFCFVILLSAICGQAQQTLPTGGTESQNQIDAPKTVAVSGDSPTAVHFSPKTTAPTAIEWAQDEYITAPFSLQQPSVYRASVQAGVFATSKGTVPFWMRSRKFGSVPLDGLSASLIGAAHKSYKTGHFKPLLDWGAGIDARFNAGSKTEVILVEAYAKARIGKLQLKAGRSRDQIGLVDSTLSSGAYAISGNSEGIPKIEIGFPQYWNVPFTNGVLALKWSFAHGWYGHYKMNPIGNIQVDEIHAYWHQKSLYARLGKPGWGVRFYGGLNHQVIWGDEDRMFANWELSTFKTFGYVITGRKYTGASVSQLTLGNSNVSVDQAMDLDWGNVTLTGYHQFFFETHARLDASRLKDGLWGATIANRAQSDARFKWHKFLAELFYTLNKEGSEDYYNSLEYYEGWSYKGENLGNPFITPKKYIRSGLPAESVRYFPNNRVVALHLAGELSYDDWHAVVFVSYSQNHGSHATNLEAGLTGTAIAAYSFPKVNQLSTYMTCKKQLRRGLDLGIELAFDQGDLLNNAVGAGVSLTKTW